MRKNGMVDIYEAMSFWRSGRGFKIVMSDKLSIYQYEDKALGNLSEVELLKDGSQQKKVIIGFSKEMFKNGRWFLI